LGTDHRQHRRRLWRHSEPARSTRFAKAIAAATGGGEVTRIAVLGVLSLILWALIVVVTLKYVVIPAARRQQWRGRHADPDGAGGSARSEKARRSWSCSARSAARCSMAMP